MNVVGLREAKSKLTQLGRQAQKGRRAIITRRGKPFCVIIGVEGEDLLDVLLRWDPDFWRDLEKRRARSASESVALEDISLKKPRRRRRSARSR
jgi:prevent-host-death family protein